MLFASMRSIQHLHNREVGIELRLDLFPHIEIEQIKDFLQNAVCPVMLTLRNASQKEALIERLLDLEPPFFDLEYDMRPQFLRDTIKKYPKTKFILSYHNYMETPNDLDGIYRSMQEHEVFSYKIAAIAHSTNDALRMLLFGKNHPQASMICMGENGRFARVLGPVVGNLIDYVCMREPAGPGQMTLSEWLDLPSLNQNTAIYGLIGDPVEKSSSHHYHNGVFRKRQLNAIYVKMRVKPEELAEFFPLARAIGMRGLSVTMPLKEKILPFLDEVDAAAKQIGAVNTLLFKNGQVVGTNTDGLGALDAIEKRSLVRGKRVVLLGAGGAARAIAFEAKARGADVMVLNRTVQRAKEVAEAIGCAARISARLV